MKGSLLFQTHQTRSFSLLVKVDQVLGARQIGGGFGGCVLALSKDHEIDQTVANIKTAYRKATGLKTNFIPIRISQGCGMRLA